ncbi:MAG: nitroreductase family protein [Parvularcula sp.]
MSRISFPARDAIIPPCFPSNETIRLLSNRRSVTAGLLESPGPTSDQLSDILMMASRVPDHRKIVPFRFLTFDETSRERLADLLVPIAAENECVKHLPEDAVRLMVQRAPAMVVLISSVNTTHRTPVWEQELTAGAVGFNLLVSASAMGFAGQWTTEWMAFDPKVAALLGLGEDERVAGFFYFGTASQSPRERARPSGTEIISAWTEPTA